jgi:hypothetical protein
LKLVHDRAAYLSSQKECPPDLLEAIHSLIWVSSRIPVDELVEVRKQLVKKYGSKFVHAANSNELEKVNPRLIAKLRVEPPSGRLINSYLVEIANEYNINWTPTDAGLPDDLNAPIPSPQGFSVPIAPGSELRSAYQRRPDVIIYNFRFRTIFLFTNRTDVGLCCCTTYPT